MLVYVQLVENCDRRVHKKTKKNNNSCSCWQVCKRSGAKPEAIKNFVRVHAVHDGAARASRGAALSPCSSDSPYSSTSRIPLQGKGRVEEGEGRLVSNIPPPLFTHPSETNEQEACRPPQSFHWNRTATVLLGLLHASNPTSDYFMKK